MTTATSTNGADPRSIARSAYKVYLNRLTFEEHRQLANSMRDLVATPGWAVLVDLIGGDFTAFAETVVLTGDFDERGAGIAAGYDRVLSFPQLAIDTFNERDRMEAAAQNQEGVGNA